MVAEETKPAVFVSNCLIISDIFCKLRKRVTLQGIFLEYYKVQTKNYVSSLQRNRFA